MEQLQTPHPSIPHHPLFLARYIEKVASGTLGMISRCWRAGLPEPVFEQRAGQFVTTIWRDWLTSTVMNELALMRDIDKRFFCTSAKTKGRITIADYQSLTGGSRQTASRDLDQLVEHKLFNRLGKGRGVYYMIAPRM